MLYDVVVELYNKFRLMHYRSLFSRIREHEGSLSATEAYAVDAIYLLGRPTIKQFSDFLGISQPNATYKINNLMAKGYVIKEPSDTDKREFRLHLTDKFFGYYDGHSRFINDAADRLSRRYSEEELALFTDMLRSLTDAVE